MYFDFTVFTCSTHIIFLNNRNVQKTELSFMNKKLTVETTFSQACGRSTTPVSQSPSSLILRRKQRELDRLVIEHPNMDSISSFKGTDGTFGVLTDKKSLVLTVNKDFSKYTGFDLHTLLGKNCNMLQRRFDSRNEKQLQLIREKMAKCESITTHLVNYTWDETEFLSIISIRPVFVERVHIGFYSVQMPALWVSVGYPIKPSTPDPTPVARRFARSRNVRDELAIMDIRPAANVRMSAVVLKRYRALRQMLESC